MSEIGVIGADDDVSDADVCSEETDVDETIGEGVAGDDVLLFSIITSNVSARVVSNAAPNATIEGMLEATPGVDASIVTKFDSPFSDDAIAVVARPITVGLNDADVDVDLDVVDIVHHPIYKAIGLNS